MAIHAGSILYDANGFIIDRLQTAGVTSLNIPQELIAELGNFGTVATIRDIPDLSFDLETLDVSVELESLLCSALSTADTDTTPASGGTQYDFGNALPLDIISPFRSAYNHYDIVKGVAIPQLSLQNVEYRYGVKQNSTEKFTFKGDSIYYIPGSPYIFKATATSGQTVFNVPGSGSTPTGGPPIPYVEHGTTKYLYNVSVNGVRKFLTADYTETYHTTYVTLTFNTGLTTNDVVRAVYGSTTASTIYPTTAGSPASTSIKPAAVRGKDIDVYVESIGATPSMIRWPGVQSASATRSVTIQNDEEFGNYQIVAQDYDQATVKASIVVKPASTADLFSKIAQVTGVSAVQTTGTFASQTQKVEIRVSNPDTGAVIKTIYIPDARFTPPAISARVNQKLTTTFDCQSDSGQIYVYAGSRP